MFEERVILQAYEDENMERETLQETLLQAEQGIDGLSEPLPGCIALNHSDQVHRIEPKGHSKLIALVADTLGDQQQNSLIAQKDTDPVKDRVIPVARVTRQR